MQEVQLFASVISYVSRFGRDLIFWMNDSLDSAEHFAKLLLSSGSNSHTVHIILSYIQVSIAFPPQDDSPSNCAFRATADGLGLC
jgi:hypothetical protein